MGKTTVLQLFRKLGARSFDVDKFVHGILKKPATIRQIVHTLGRGVLTGDRSRLSLNKKRVAEIIFRDPEKRKAVERIIHPQVLKMIKETGSGILKKDPSALIVFEVPLLFEAGYEKYFDRTVAVYCRRDTAVGRLLKKGVSRDEIYARLRAQMPVTRKIKLADFVINNSYDTVRTEKQVRRILARLGIR